MKLGKIIAFFFMTLAIFGAPHPSIAAPSLDLISTAVFDEAYPNEGVMLGQGWNSLTGERTLSVCVKGKKEDFKGGSVTADYQYLYDREQLENALNVTASATYNGGDYGGSVSATFSRVVTNDRAKTNILGRAIMDTGASYLVNTFEEPLKLSDQVVNSLSDADQFRQLCGDSFVEAIHTGGELAILFTEDNTDSKNTVKQGIDVTAGGLGNNAHVNVSQTAITQLTTSDVQVTQLQTGGTLSTPTSGTAAVTKLATYASDATSPVPYRITVVPYSLLPGNRYIDDGNRLYMQRAFWEYGRLMELSALYDAAVVDERNYYNPFYAGRKELSDAAVSLWVAIRCLEPLLAQCRNYGHCGLVDNSGNEKKDTTSFLKVAITINTCPLNDEALALSVEQKTLVLALIGATGSKNDSVLTSLGQTSLKTSVKEVSSNSFLGMILPTGLLPQKTGQNASADSTASDATASNTEASIADVFAPLRISDFYYGLLAKAPLRRVSKSDAPDSLLAGDELQDLNTLCKARWTEPQCTTILKKVFSIKQPGTGDSDVVTAFSDWVLLRRLAPLSQTFCSQTLQDPMCKSPDELKAWAPVAQNIWLGADHGFMTPSPPKTTETSLAPRFMDVCGRTPSMCAK